LDHVITVTIVCSCAATAAAFAALILLLLFACAEERKDMTVSETTEVHLKIFASSLHVDNARTLLPFDFVPY
jgi:hypothetical protein